MSEKYDSIHVFVTIKGVSLGQVKYKYQGPIYEEYVIKDSLTLNIH